MNAPLSLLLFVPIQKTLTSCAQLRESPWGSQVASDEECPRILRLHTLRPRPKSLSVRLGLTARRPAHLLLLDFSYELPGHIEALAI